MPIYRFLLLLRVGFSIDGNCSVSGKEDRIKEVSDIERESFGGIPTLGLADNYHKYSSKDTY